MATCHSLRVVDGELLGDPLDVKMFQFTGWSYEEGGGHASESTSPKFDNILPSVAKPPKAHPGESLHNHRSVSSTTVVHCQLDNMILIIDSLCRFPSSLVSYGVLNSCLSFAAQALWYDSLVKMGQASL